MSMPSSDPIIDWKISDLHDKSEESRWHWLKWIPTSNAKLAQAEEKILQRCKCRLEKFFLPIFDSSLYVRTIIARNYGQIESTLPLGSNKFEQRIPLVLIHGFASGVGLWCKNLDSLATFRRVYAFDLIGFGRSSRPPFPQTAEEVENRFVEVIEEWRKNMNLDKFILLGHSMGGFLAASYALSHSRRIAHLVLIDPWGFAGPEESSIVRPAGIRGWVFKKLSTFRALTTMRMIGPFGLNAMRKIRQDIEHVYSQVPVPLDGNPESTDCPLDSSCENPWSSDSNSSTTVKSGSQKNANFGAISPYDPAVVYNYIYHINVRHPTGEDAFRSMSQMLGWAARPMLPRISQLDASVPITFIYGGRSWIDMSSGLRARALRPNSYVDVMVIEGGGHHAYAQYAEDFNNYVNTIASLADEGYVFRPDSGEAVKDLTAQPNHCVNPPSSRVADGNADEFSN